ncbi:GNAT family N-acetyltransferase [Trinickia diaoshuihuensis]|uniref:GNAT family N-acetyltransferase n=1 Tax=Trinickia diaoshuihuensis TaxID=2292265 RepID=UPI001967615F|nr:GNAT family N-acetyltransferase [Trinickia diaoshuihuensis]
MENVESESEGGVVDFVDSTVRTELQASKVASVVKDDHRDGFGRLIVRPAKPYDWSHIFLIWKQVVSAGRTHPYPLESTEQDAVKLWLEPPRSAVYVGEVDGRIVAAMMTKPMRYGNGDHIANFDLMVHPDCRGRGVGRAVASYVIDATRRAGYKAMEAYAVVAVNAPAVALWHGLGFKTVATIPSAFRHPDHGLVPVHYMYQAL